MNTKSYKTGLLMASLLSLSLVTQGAENRSSATQTNTLKPSDSHKEQVEATELCCCETWAVVGTGNEDSPVLSAGKAPRLNGQSPWVAQLNVSGSGSRLSVVRPQSSRENYVLASLGTGTDTSSVTSLKGQGSVSRSGPSWNVVGEHRAGAPSATVARKGTTSSASDPWVVNGSGSSLSTVQVASLKGTAVTGTPDVSWRIVHPGSSLQAGKVGNSANSAEGSGWLVVGANLESGSAALPLRPDVLQPAYRLAVLGSDSDAGLSSSAPLKGRLLKDCE